MKFESGPSNYSDGYILGAGDRVKVDFFNASKYTAEFPVLPNGTIQFPLVGAINVRGISLTDAGTRISVRFKPYFKRSIATVTLITARPLGVSISEEVNRPGFSLGFSLKKVHFYLKYETLLNSA